MARGIIDIRSPCHGGEKIIRRGYPLEEKRKALLNLLQRIDWGRDIPKATRLLRLLELVVSAPTL